MNNQNELYHYGVLGMKWGRRKNKYARSYTKKERTKDFEKYGKSGVRRINRDIKKGYSLDTARTRESSAKRHLRIEKAKFVAGNAAYVAGAAAASVAMSKLVKNGKMSAISAHKIANGASKVRDTLNFYQGVKVMSLGIKATFGMQAEKGRDY